MTVLATFSEPAYSLGVYGDKSMFSFTPRVGGKHEVLAVFADDSPAVVNLTLGLGAVTYCGFHPGFAYFHPAMPLRPVDRTPSLHSLTNFVPNGFDTGARTLVATALTSAATRW